MEMTRIEKRIVNSDARSRSVARGAVRRLLPLAPRGGQSYLELGCGNGAAALAVASELRLHVVGIDVDTDQIAIARAAGGGRDVRFEIADAERLPFDDDTFDYVASYRVTHHIPRWQTAFVEMARVLAPGGRLIYTDFVVPRWAAAVGARLLGGSLGFPTRGEIEELVTRLRLEPVSAARALLNLDAVWRKPLR